MNHSYVDPGLRCIGQSFVVLAQPTAPAEPRECSFNHPSSRQHLKVDLPPAFVPPVMLHRRAPEQDRQAARSPAPAVCSLGSCAA